MDVGCDLKGRYECFQNAVEHCKEEFRTLTSDLGHVVEGLLEIVADLSGLEPSDHGASSGDGGESAEDEGKKVGLDFG